jgi:hypothetical protein
VWEEELGDVGAGPRSTAMAPPCASAVPLLVFAGVLGPRAWLPLAGEGAPRIRSGMCLPSSVDHAADDCD